MDSKPDNLVPATAVAANSPGGWQDLPREIAACWQQLPNKGMFFIALAAWLALFQFLGNGTFGYVNTKSLMYWMYNAYNNEQSDGQDAHGLLIPFVVIGLMWWKRKELLAVQFRAWWPALALLAGALFLHIFGFWVQQERISIVAFFAGIYALMGMAWGPGWLRRTFFPFFLFAFCIPISSIGEPITTITFDLRILVTKIVAFICDNILFLDVVREGTQLFNSAHTYSYEVAAACSGMRSLVAIFALSMIWGFMNFKSIWRRLLMIAAGVPLAVISNAIRLLCIIIAAEFSGQQGGNYIHDSEIFSLLPYIPAFLGVMFLGRWLREPEPAPASAAAISEPESA